MVAEGRFEFVNGGWVAHDEACPTYLDIIDNMVVGHKFLKDELGITAPKIAWHADAFGHTSANADLFA